MKRLIILIASIFIISNAYSQEMKFERPNYKKIRREIKKRKSNLYYKKLFDRYINGDTTFNLNEKRHLYYGFSFQEDYSPYGISTYSDSLTIFYEKDTLTESDFNEIIKFSKLLLDENPFDLRALDNLNYAYYRLGNKELENLYNYKLLLILDAIMSSGDGISEKSAFYVIYISHEYDLLNALGFGFGGEQSFTTNGYDYLKLQDNEFGIEGFYFEISRSLEQLNLMFK
ncbi:MAG: hypothetical protein CSA95_05820 [Bacteroidetes bacterium]|nr:MAG: hypothetical protein CSA95_05820 [Bacteroidota bacterium]